MQKKKKLGMYVVRYLAILFMYTQDSYLHLLFKDILLSYLGKWRYVYEVDGNNILKYMVVKTNYYLLYIITVYTFL